MADANKVSVSVIGYHETMKALRTLDPELRKQTRKEIRGASNIVRKAAMSKIPKTPPMSGWQTQPSTGGIGTNQYGVSGRPMVRGGTGWIPWFVTPKHFKIDIGRQRRQLNKQQWNVVRVVGLGASVQAFEFAGTRGGSGTKSSQQYIRNLNLYGQPGRGLWSAFDANKFQVDQSIQQAIKNAESKVSSELRQVK